MQHLVPGSRAGVRGIVVLAAALAGCGAEAPEPGAPDPAPPPEGISVVADLVAHVRPGQRAITFERVGHRVEAGPGLHPEDITDLTITQDGTPGSGPANSVELVTNSTGTGVSCPGMKSGTFCGNVTLRHFYGLTLSDVHVQVTSITDATTGVDVTATHGAINSDPSAFGLAQGAGLWRYTSASATQAGVMNPSPDNAGTRDWVFLDADGADTNVYLRVVASLYPTIRFNADGTTSQSATLRAGQPGIVHFDHARLGTCRGANWAITAFFNGPNTRNHSITFKGSAGGTYLDAHFTVPFGDTAFWFNNTDDTGCAAWDSNFGSNFHFSPQGTTPVIHFQQPNNWTPWVEGTLRKGQPFTVEFDLARIGPCQGTSAYDRVPSGSQVLMFHRYDGDDANLQVVSMSSLPFGVPGTINGETGEIQVAPTVTAKAGASKLNLWFQSTGPSSCSIYDSVFGSNYNFDLSP